MSHHTDIIIIYRFTEVSPRPMANNVLGVVYSNKKIAASAPGWVQAGYLGMGPWGPEPHTALWANHLKGWCIFWNWPLSGLQSVEMCAGLLQSVPKGAAECVLGYRVCAGCSFNILACSS